MSLWGSSAVSSAVQRCAARCRELFAGKAASATYSRNARRINAPRKRHSTRGRPRKFTAEDPSYITQRRRIRITRRRSVYGPASFIPVSSTFSRFAAFVRRDRKKDFKSASTTCVANHESFIIFFTNYLLLFFISLYFEIMLLQRDDFSLQRNATI